MKDFVKVFLVVTVLASVFYWGRHLGETNSKAYKDFVIAESEAQKNIHAQEKLRNVKGSFQSIFDKSEFKNSSELLTQMMTILLTDFSIYIKPENTKKLQAANVEWNKELAEKNARSLEEQAEFETEASNQSTSIIDKDSTNQNLNVVKNHNQDSTLKVHNNSVLHQKFSDDPIIENNNVESFFTRENDRTEKSDFGQEEISVSQLLQKETSRKIAEERYPFNEKKYKSSEWLIQNSEEEKQIELSLKALELRSLSAILEKAKRASFEETKQLTGSYRGTLKDVLGQGYATLMIDFTEKKTDNSFSQTHTETESQALGTNNIHPSLLSVNSTDQTNSSTHSTQEDTTEADFIRLLQKKKYSTNGIIGKIALLREGQVEFEKTFDTEHLGFINHDFSAHFIEISSNKMLQIYKIPSQSKLAGILYERLPNGSTKTIGRFTLINTRF